MRILGCFDQRLNRCAPAVPGQTASPRAEVVLLVSGSERVSHFRIRASLCVYPFFSPLVSQSAEDSSECATIALFFLSVCYHLSLTP